jgi:putative ABC transport system permease protein
MVRLVIASVRANVRRLLSTGLAVCLGVALLCGTMLLGDTLRANFDSLFTTALGKSDAVVRSSNTLDTDGEFAQDLLDTSLVRELESVDGVATVAPQIEGFGQLTGADGQKLGGEGPPTLAGNWIDDPALNPYQLVAGRTPRAPDEVVINRGAAKDGDLRVGDTTIITSPEPAEVTIVGLATFGGEDGLGPTTFAAFSLDGAQEHITGRPDTVTSFLVRAEPDVSQDEIVQRLSRVVPKGVEVISGADLVAEANDEINSDFLGFLRTFLLVFAGVALLVATFSINNTFAIIAAQRQRSSALLRALGADRRQVLGAAVGEAAVVGVVASLIGLGIGVLLASGLKLVFDAFGFALPDGGLAMKGATFAIAGLVGVLLTLVAALAPAVRASRIAPLAALRDVAVDRSGASVRRAGVGSVLLLAGVAGVVLGAARGQLALGGLGALLTAAGVVTLGPVVARPGGTVIGAPAAKWRGVAGMLARRNAVRNPRRTSATASALLVGIGVVTIFTVFAGSLKTSFADSIETVVRGDLIIATSGFGGGGLSPSIVDAIDAVPKIDHAVGTATGPVAIEGRTEQITALDPSASIDLLVPQRVAGVAVSDLGANEVAVNDQLADERAWQVGDVLDFRFGDGTRQRLRVASVFDSTALLQPIIVPRATWDAHQVQTVDNLVVMGLADGVSIEAGRRAVNQAVAGFAAPDVQTQEEYVADAAAQVDQFLGLIYIMLLLAIVIALMGIANTLSLSIYERVRELGLLRAVGADRRQVRSMVRWESVVIAVLGTVGGVLLGVFLGWGLVTAASQGAFSITFAPPVAQLVVVAVAGGAAGMIAAIRPARRAARLEVIGALALGE